MIAGVIAKEFGPEVGGLFLAFPAIFFASATLIEKHERERKEKKGYRGAKRGKDAAALDAAGAALGSAALAGFGLLIWLLARPLGMLSLFVALAAWMATSLLLWRFSAATAPNIPPDGRGGEAACGPSVNDSSGTEQKSARFIRGLNCPLRRIGM